MPALFPTTAHGASTGAELVTSDGRALPLVATTLHAVAEGGIARYVLEQTYRNAYDETLHVIYRMPLPADGAVSGYAFEIGGRVIKGVVDRKRAARERFEQAILSGHTAALLEQERQDIFAQKLGNIPGGETVTARITVDQRLAWLPEGEWELRFPTVIGPRYCGSAETANDVRATHVKVTDQPLAVKVQLALSIKDAITGGRKPVSTSHAIAKREDGVLELGAGARLDRDLVVRWPVAAPEVGLSLVTGQGYGLVTIVPPAPAANRQTVARDLIVLLDTSGSMEGGPLAKAKQVVAMVIDSLAPHDRFELIEFASSPSRYKREPLEASHKAKQDAIRWVHARSAGGGTEMRAGVIEALSTLRIGAQRQVIVVTDGYIGGEQQILEVLHERLPRSCRLHVLGVGDAVNRSLATSLARAGRGAEVILGLAEDAERGAKRLLDRTRAPMMVNVEIAGSALVRHAPDHMPDVFAGAPLVAALALSAEGGELIVRGELADGPWEQRVRVPAQRPDLGEPRTSLAPDDGNAAIRALYGRERIADLESRSMLESVDGQVEALGLEFQLATRLTSWVAVDESRVIAKAPAREVVVPQEIPHGTSARAFGLRQGAMPMMVMRDVMADLAEGSAQTEIGEDDVFGSVVDFAHAPRASAMAPMAPSSSTAPHDTFVGNAGGDDLDDLAAEEFESEQPTGVQAPSLAQAARRSAPAPMGPPSSAMRPPGAPALGGPKSPPASPKPAPGPVPAPEPAPMLARAKQRELPSMTPERAPVEKRLVIGAPSKRATLLLWVLALLALIALLIWWLAR